MALWEIGHRRPPFAIELFGTGAQHRECTICIVRCTLAIMAGASGSVWRPIARHVQCRAVSIGKRAERRSTMVDGSTMGFRMGFCGKQWFRGNLVCVFAIDWFDLARLWFDWFMDEMRIWVEFCCGFFCSLWWFYCFHMNVKSIWSLWWGEIFSLMFWVFFFGNWYVNFMMLVKKLKVLIALNIA